MTNKQELKLDYFSIENFGWINIRPHLISFGLNLLPNDIHFTIGFDERLSDINLHLTKNVNDKENKPHIKLVVIDKKLFEEIVPEIASKLLYSFLTPISIDELKTKCNEIGFLSFDKLEHFEGYSFNELLENYKENLKKVSSRKLKIKKEVQNDLLNFVTDETYQNKIFDLIDELPIEFEKSIDGGIIITNENVIQVIRINDVWYTFNLDLNPMDILKAIVEPKLAEFLVERTKSFIEIIKNCNTYSDTEKYNTPIRLEWVEL
jgi:hypothetical protein